MNRQPTIRHYLAVSIFWFAVSFFWGAMLSVVLQDRVKEMVRLENPALARAADASRDQDALKKDPGASGVAARQAPARPPSEAEKKLESEVAKRLGWLLAVGALIAAFTQVIAGALSDCSLHRMGRRRPFLVIGLATASVGIILFPMVHSYIGLLLDFLLIQFCLNFASGPYQALLPDMVSPEHYGTASAYMGLFALVGRTGGMVGGSLLHNQPRGMVILTVTFLVLLNGLGLGSALLAHEKPLTEPIPGGVTKALRSIFGEELTAHPSFIWVLVSRFVINVGVYTILPFLLFYLMHVFNLNDREAHDKYAVVGLLVNLCGMVATFPAGRASDRFSKKQVVYVFSGICIVAGFSFAMSGSVLMAMVSAGLFGFGYGAFCAVDWALVCSVLPPGQPAKYLGVWGFGETLPQVVAPLFGSAIAAWGIRHYSPAIGYRMVMMSAIAWFALGTYFIRFVRERRVG